MKKLDAFAKTMNFEVVGESIDMKQSLSQKTAAKAIALGEAMAKRLMEEM